MNLLLTDLNVCSNEVTLSKVYNTADLKKTSCSKYASMQVNKDRSNMFFKLFKSLKKSQH